MNFKEISQNYVTFYAAYREERNKIQNRIEIYTARLARLDKKLGKAYTKHPSWITCLIKPIAEAMLLFLPGRYYEILGPFGIGARTSIHFYRDGVTDKTRWTDDNCMSITFEPGNLEEGRLSVVDEMTDLGCYTPDSFGGMNGFNHPCLPVPEDADAKWFVDFMNHQRAISRKRWEEKQAKAETA